MSDCASCSSCDGCSVLNKFDETKKRTAGQQDFMYTAGEYSRPLSMMLGLTNDCNLACPYCFVSQTASYMSLEVAEQSVEWLKGNYAEKGINIEENRMTVIFFGGEPLLRFEEVIKPLVEKYHSIVSFGITTNGVLLTPDVVDFFYKYQIQPLLSLDGCAETQNSQRPGKGFNSFETILGNIQYLLLRFPMTTMRATLTKNSIPYLYENVLMAEELGFKTTAFCPNAFEEWNLEDEKEFYNQLNKVGLHIYKQFNDANNYPIIQVDPLVRKFAHLEALIGDGLKFNNNIGRCGLGTTSCAITPDGRIIPCQEKTSNPTVTFGDVFNGIDEQEHEKFLQEYWESVNNITCDKHCSERERVMCLADTCPSRLEDQGFTFSTSLCVFNRVSTKIAARLHFLCADSGNSYIRQYFLGGVVC